MKSSTPKISVITPTYNRADYIAETITSVLEQDFEDFEYLILDDGSSDNTADIVKPFLKDKRVKYLKHTNVGEAETINWGWQLAKGKYFVQVNSDDPILPGLFNKMVDILDKNSQFVVAYPNFYFINQHGKIIKKTVTKKWNFTRLLSIYSCECATPGTFIRRSTFDDWKVIKDGSYKHISDVKMYWNMALRGSFIQVPEYLATWREHSGSISAQRYKSISEVERWFMEYFNQKNLPKEIKECKPKTQKSMYRYFLHLLHQANTGDLNEEINLYKSKLNIRTYQFNNLQVGDNDLIGNKFNGHDLHNYLLNKNIYSTHLVWNKQSKDRNTYIISGYHNDRESIRSFTKYINSEYSLNTLNNIQTYDILYNRLFLESNVVHYHLFHNDIGNLQLLPLLTRLKPTVWTIHDTWALGGHCIYHFDCQKWQSHCGDCPYLDVNFSLQKDNSALNFALKKDAIQNSNFHAIVASKWMLQKLQLSPMFQNKTIHLVPFGINQKIFKPFTKVSARKNLGIPKNALVIAFRCDASKFKGLEAIEYVLRHIKTDKKIVLLVLVNRLRENPRKFVAKQYGWVTDDRKLAQIYSASDIFLMPSTMEAFGMMAIEAMSCGTLPIVMNGTALPEVVNAPSCGISTSQDKVEYLKAVQYYLDNEEERKQRANKCLIFAQQKYNADNYLKHMVDIYQSAIKNHHISEEDHYLLAQIKKNMCVEPALNASFISRTTNSKLKRKALYTFYRISQYAPQSARTQVKQWLHEREIYL